MFRSLRQRLGFNIALLIAGSVIVGAVAVWGINGLHEDVGFTARAFRQLRSVYEAGYHVSAARSAVAAAPPNRARAIAAVRSANAALATESSTDVPPADWLDPAATGRLLASLRAAERSPAVAPLDDALHQIADISSSLRRQLTDRETRAGADRRKAIATVVFTASVVALVAVVLGVRQHRAVMRPLDRLAAAVNRVAAGDFTGREQPRGDLEFASLTRDFNQMSAELESLYADLEAKVAAQSKALVRSERLASVGYLAAGVAHEINNPLGVIAGYGERALQLLARADDSPPAVRRAVEVICDEAFRCKDITERLLCLARPGVTARGPVALKPLAVEVVSTITALPKYAGRRVTVEADGEAAFVVTASEGEMKQVLVNLIVNALDAVSPIGGSVTVRLTATSSNDAIQLAVVDNGRGMNAETLDRVFEPFFRASRDGEPSRPGTGLGLSITHAIVVDHGGAITAYSDGEGRGSRFVVTLPSGSPCAVPLPGTPGRG